MRWFLVGLVMAIFCSRADAKTFSETTVQCDPSFTAFVDEETEKGTPDRHAPTLHVIVRCVTVDNRGSIIRSLGDKDITNRLTSAQIAGMLAILGRLTTLVAVSESVPTPPGTPTPAVAVTPGTLITP